ncbi:MAG: hypothetical protein EOO15_15040 [Chitinophagaceae bacterium]|nr:MAG: hypothetical protein EOO15_15040 [Chitinophagaceae bacterium]
MKLGERLLKELNKKFAPAESRQLKVAGYDILVNTDEQGNAIQAFIGKADPHGSIRGDRFARTLKYDREGKLIKDHWERKGKAT